MHIKRQSGGREKVSADSWNLSFDEQAFFHNNLLVRHAHYDGQIYRGSFGVEE